MKLVVDYLKTLLKKGDTIILGCSGGPDSMCLLSLLMKENINIIDEKSFVEKVRLVKYALSLPPHFQLNLQSCEQHARFFQVHA